MHTIFKNVPESFIGLVYIVCGTVILLDVIGAIRSGLLGAIGAIILLWHGFIFVQGPKHMKNLLDRFQKK